MDDILEILIDKAMEAQKLAYAPYSNFHVGASVKCKSDRIYTGANIENASYPATICAERVAVSKAISEGEKVIEKIAIVGDSSYTHPCGICRQFLNEFSNENTEIIVVKDKEHYKIYKLKELLPYSFGKEDIGEKNV